MLIISIQLLGTITHFSVHQRLAYHTFLSNDNSVSADWCKNISQYSSAHNNVQCLYFAGNQIAEEGRKPGLELPPKKVCCFQYVVMYAGFFQFA